MSREFKKICLLVVLAAVLGGMLGGCTGNPGQTGAERSLRIRQIFATEVKMFADDWDYFWLVDRSTRLTPWHVEIGY
jgi:hypothetical protein